MVSIDTVKAFHGTSLSSFWLSYIVTFHSSQGLAYSLDFSYFSLDVPWSVDETCRYLLRKASNIIRGRARSSRGPNESTIRSSHGLRQAQSNAEGRTHEAQSGQGIHVWRIHCAYTSVQATALSRPSACSFVRISARCWCDVQHHLPQIWTAFIGRYDSQKVSLSTDIVSCRVPMKNQKSSSRFVSYRSQPSDPTREIDGSEESSPLQGTKVKLYGTTGTF